MTSNDAAWAYHLRRTRTPAAVLILVLIGLLVAQLLPRTGAVAAAPGPPASLFPSNGAYLGARVGQRASESMQDAMVRVESQIGRKFAIDHAFYQWTKAIPTSYETWTVSQGRIPFINWKMPSSWSRVASGAEDSWIATRAEAFKSFGHPVYLAVHHEPENDPSYGSPADYAAAWRRVVDIFRQHGVTNVAFVWTMMGWSFDPRSGRTATNWYPGDGYIDIIGADGYNWAPAKAGSKWTMFESIFSSVNGFAEARGKPWMVVEYGVQEDPSDASRKGAWLREALATAKTWPGLIGLIYFDLTKDGYPWQTDSSATSMQAYRQMANDPYVKPNAAPSPPTTPPPTTPPPTTPPPTTPPPTTQPPTTQPPTTQPPTPDDGEPTLHNPLDTGSVGEIVTIENSGQSGSALDDVIADDGASIVFDTLDGTNTALTGGLSALHTAPSGEPAYYDWKESFRWEPTWWGRVYVRFDGEPDGKVRIVRGKDDGNVRFGVSVDRDGRVAIVGTVKEVLATSSKQIDLRGWVRIEWKVDHATGTVEVRFFNDADSTQPDEVLVASNRDLGPGTSRVSFGRVDQRSFTTRLWTDSPALSVLGWIGPGN
jgi:hypothetical protein